MTDTANDGLTEALGEHLRLIARLLIARGVTVGTVTEILKTALIKAAEDLEGTGVSDSRASLLTGVHRKDVRRLRAEEGAVPQAKTKLTATARVLALWAADPDYLDEEGAPRLLSRSGDGTSPSFEDLARKSKADMAPGTLLKALVDQGAVGQLPDNMLRLERTSAVPEAGSPEQLDAYRITIAAHLAAATHNILSDPDAPRFFERALRYTHLSDAALAELDAEARAAASALLDHLNSKARTLQAADSGAGHQGTFTFGAYALPKTAEDT
jgi:hypothetical protein